MVLTEATIIAVISGIFGLSNLVMFLVQRHDAKYGKNRPEYRMILGLGHDIIISRGESYLNRGYITRDEYENLNDYLYKPYLEMGGNGTVERLIEEVRQLPIRHISMTQQAQQAHQNNPSPAQP